MDVEVRSRELFHVDFTGFLSFLTCCVEAAFCDINLSNLQPVASQIRANIGVCSPVIGAIPVTAMGDRSSNNICYRSFFSTLFLYGYWCPLVELEKIP